MKKSKDHCFRYIVILLLIYIVVQIQKPNGFIRLFNLMFD